LYELLPFGNVAQISIWFTSPIFLALEFLGSWVVLKHMNEKMLFSDDHFLIVACAAIGAPLVIYCAEHLLRIAEARKEAKIAREAEQRIARLQKPELKPEEAEAPTPVRPPADYAHDGLLDYLTADPTIRSLRPVNSRRRIVLQYEAIKARVCLPFARQ